MSKKSSDLDFVTSLADTDYIAVIASGSNKRILISDLKKILGGGTSTGTGTSTGSKNLFSTPDDLSGGGTSKFTIYDPQGQISRPSAKEVIISSPFTGPCVVYEEISTGILVPNSLYTVGIDATLKSGTGYVTVHGDWSGQPGVDSDNTSMVVGTKVRLTKSFKVPAGVPNSHIGLRFWGSGTFDFDRFTLVPGSTDIPDAVVA